MKRLESGLTSGRRDCMIHIGEDMERATLKIEPQDAMLYFRLAEAEIFESEEVEPGMILDFDERGNLVGIEVFTAGSR